MNLHQRVAKSKKNLKAYLRHNSNEFSQPMWSADGYSLSFEMKSDNGVYAVTAQFIPFENNLRITLETGVLCLEPYYLQMISYLAYALKALEINTVYSIEKNGEVISTYLLSFDSSAIEDDDYQKAFYHLTCSIDYCYEDIAKIAVGQPIFGPEFVQARIDDRMDKALVESLKKTIAEIKNTPSDYEDEDYDDC